MNDFCLGPIGMRFEEPKDFEWSKSLFEDGNVVVFSEDLNVMVIFSCALPDRNVELAIAIDYMNSGILCEAIEVFDKHPIEGNRFAIQLNSAALTMSDDDQFDVINPKLTLLTKDCSGELEFVIEGYLNSDQIPFQVHIPTNDGIMVMIGNLLNIIGGSIDNQVQIKADEERAAIRSESVLDAMEEDSRSNFRPSLTPVSGL